MRAVLNYFETLSMANEKCRWEQRGLGGADTVCERKRDSGAHTHSNTYSEEEKHSCDPKAHSRGGHTQNNAGVCAHSKLVNLGRRPKMSLPTQKQIEGVYNY